METAPASACEQVLFRHFDGRGSNMTNETEPAVFSISIDQVRDFQFRVKFDKEHYADLLLDEAPPVGGDTAPNPSRILAAAIGNCLCASLLFSARKVRANLERVQAVVKVWYARNEQGRLRIGRVKVEIHPEFEAGTDPARMERCRALFEDYCVVTQSVRAGIDTIVEVKTGSAPVQ